LANHWYLGHCSPNQHVKVCVLYQKLLKCYLLNELRSQPEKAMTKQNFDQATYGKQNSSRRPKLDWVKAGLQVCRSVYCRRFRP
jgi:pre-mRNA-processing factor 8